MLAHGRRDPAAIAGVMQGHPGAQNQILALLNQTLGSSFVRAVLDLIMPGAASPAAGPAGAGGATGSMRVTAHGLHVRSSPSKANDDNVVGMLPYHAIVEASGQHGEWVGIEHGSKPAFVFGRYVEPVARPVATTVASTPAGPAVAHPAPHESVAAVPTAPVAPAHHEVAPAPAAPVAAAPVAPVIAAPTPAAAPVHPVVTPPTSTVAPIDHPAVDHPAVDHPATRQPDPAHVAAPAKVDAAHKDGAKPKKQAPPSGFTKYGGGTVKSVLTRLANSGKLKITGNQIAQLDAVAQVETGGQVSGVDTTDDQVVSIGFHQVVLGHKSIEAVMLKAPAAFAKHGLTLDMSAKYNFASKPHQIAGAPDYDDLRGHDWGMKFYQASLEPEVIVAIAEFALAEATVVEGITRESGGTGDLFNDDTARAWLLEVHNNRPSYTGPSVKKAIENGAKSAKDRDHFLDILGAAIVDTYGVMEPLTILHNEKAALPKGKQLTAEEEATLLEKLKAKYSPKGRTKGTHIITKMSRHLDIPKLDPAPAATAPAAPHDAPVVAPHDTPAPVHHDAPAPVHHDAPAPVHHDAPAPVHHDAPAPVHHDAPAPVTAPPRVAGPEAKPATPVHHDAPAPAHHDAPAAAHHDAPAPGAAPAKPAPVPKSPELHEAQAAVSSSGHAPPPLDHMAQFVYEVNAGGVTQKALVFVAGGQLTLTPDVFLFFHGQWADYGIAPKQLADRKAAEHARIAREKADPSKDPKKIHGDETAGYVESGRHAAEEAMQHAQGRNVISILPQGVMGGGGSTGGHMAGLTAKGGGLPAFIESVMTSLQHDLHGDKLKPGRISIAGHSAGGYMGIHEALANAGDMKDTITDVTLMDADYNGQQFANASSWLLQGKPGKSFRIVASTGQLKSGLHLEYFGPANLKKHAEANGFTVVDKGGAGQPRGPKTTVVSHAQIMKDSEVHGDVLILNTAMGHHEIRDNVMDDSILNIGNGGNGGGDAYGTVIHGVAPAEAAGHGTAPTAAPAAAHAAQTPAPHADTHAAPEPHADPHAAPRPEAHAAPKPHADAHAHAAASDHEPVDPAEAPQHNPDPSAPETPAKIKVPSNSASKDIYAAGGVLNVSHLTRGKNNTLDDQELEFKQRVYLACTEARMTQKIFGGLADEELDHITGYPVNEPQRFRKILLPSLYSLLSAMDRDLKAGKPAGGIPTTDVKGVGIISGYRGPKEEIGLWDKYFQQYLTATTASRAATGEPFGAAAVKLMVQYIGKRKAAPGHSNHSNGTAVDIWALSKTHKIPNEFGNQAAWYASWHYAWLKANAASYNFRNYDAEAWHWEYNT